MESVPVLDLQGCHREALIQTMDAALRKYGFFYVKNHGMDADLIQRQFDVASDIFDLPLHAKLDMPHDNDLHVGYHGKGKQSLDPTGATANGDTKEGFMMTNNILISSALTSTKSKPAVMIDPDDIFAGSFNYQPKGVANLHVLRDYANQAYQLNHALNTVLLDALDVHDVAMRATLVGQPFVVLKLNKYAADEPSDPTVGKFGAGAHTDWGTFTILATDKTPGLEIYMPNDTQGSGGSDAGEWLPVPPRPGCLIVNSGDQIAHLTNDTYRSAFHRVVTSSLRPRFSTAYFTYFNMDATIEPLPQFLVAPKETDSDGRSHSATRGAVAAKYPTRTSVDYFLFKLHESMGKLVAQ